MDMHHRKRIAVQEPHHVAHTIHIKLFRREGHLPTLLLPQERGDAYSERPRQFHTVTFSRHREKHGVQLLLFHFLGGTVLLKNRELELYTKAIARSFEGCPVRFRGRIYRRPVPCAPEQGTQHDHGDNQGDGF